MELIKKYLICEGYNKWELDEFIKKAKNKKAWEKRGDSIGLSFKWNDKKSQMGSNSAYAVVQLLTPKNYKGDGAEKRHGKYKASINTDRGKSIFIGDFNSENDAKKALIDYIISHIKQNTK